MTKKHSLIFKIFKYEWDSLSEQTGIKDSYFKENQHSKAKQHLSGCVEPDAEM